MDNNIYCNKCNAWYNRTGQRGICQLKCPNNHLFFEAFCPECNAWITFSGTKGNSPLICTKGHNFFESLCSVCNTWCIWLGKKGSFQLSCHNKHNFFEIYCPPCNEWYQFKGIRTPSHITCKRGHDMLDLYCDVCHEWFLFNENKNCIVKCAKGDLIKVDMSLLNRIIIPNNNNTECVICLENLDQRVMLFPCGHTQFHEKCINKTNTCPLCRSAYTMIHKIFI